jgi:hypothetical protein
MRIARLPLLAVAPLVVVACSSSSDADESTTTVAAVTIPADVSNESVTTDPPAWDPNTEVSDYDNAAYCALAAEVQTIAAAEPTSVEDLMSAMQQLFTVQQGMAALAPAEVKDAHQTLADAGAALEAGLDGRGPVTEENFAEIRGALIEELEAEFGDLNAETAVVGAFIQDQCGPSIEP